MLPRIFFAPVAAASATVNSVGDLPGDLPAIAAICDDTNLFLITESAGAHGAGAIWALPLSGNGTAELLHSFDPAQGSGKPGRALLLKDGWLYGVTTGSHATTGATVYRFNVSTRVYENVSVLPVNATCVPVSLAIAPNGDLFVLTSAAAGPKPWFSFTIQIFFQHGVAQFPIGAESGTLLRLPVGGNLEPVHTFRPAGAPYRTAALNLPSEIVCDSDGVLYGTTTARRLFTLVPGQSIRWMTESPDEGLPEGPFGSSFASSGTTHTAYLKDCRVPLHVTPAGIRFHASVRGTGGTYALTSGQMVRRHDEHWPSELEWAMMYIPLGPGRSAALLDSVGSRQTELRLVLASSAGGLRPLRKIEGSGSAIAAGVDSETLIASELNVVLPSSEPRQGSRFKSFRMAANSNPVCVPDRFQGADALQFGRFPGDANPPDRFFDVGQNDVDPEGDQLVITSVSQPADGILEYSEGSARTVMLTALPAAAVFEVVASYSVTDGFGGTGSASITFLNQRPEGKVAVRPFSAAGVEVQSSDLGEDPDGDLLFFTGVQGAQMTASNHGLNARFVVPALGDYVVQMIDALGAETTAALRVTPAVAVTRTETLYLTADSALHFIPDSGVPANQRTITIVDPPDFGTALPGSEGLRYTAGPSFAGQDSFTYVVGSPFGDLLRVTVEVRDGLGFLKGTYHAHGPDGRSLARITVDAKGRYTLNFRIGGRVYRKRGIVSNNDQWILPRPGPDLVVSVGIVLAPEPKLQFLLGEEGGVPAPVSLLSASELSALRAPRVHAELTNVEVTPPKVRFVGGAFHVAEPGARKALPASYAIFMRTSGGGVAVIGRLWDGRPWATASVVSAEDQIAIAADRFSGTLSARRNGNIVGTLTTTFGTPRVVTTVGGSPFRAPAAGRNVFGGQQTAVSLRSQFPADITVTAAVNSDGRVTAALPYGISHSLQIRAGDGLLTGSIQPPWSGGSKGVTGLYIPHRKHVVGLVGDPSAKALLIRRK